MPQHEKRTNFIFLQSLDTMFTYGFTTAHTAAHHSIYDGNFLVT